jgi:hypothetical protein
MRNRKEKRKAVGTHTPADPVLSISVYSHTVPCTASDSLISYRLQQLEVCLLDELIDCFGFCTDSIQYILYIDSKM